MKFRSCIAARWCRYKLSICTLLLILLPIGPVCAQGWGDYAFIVIVNDYRGERFSNSLQAIANTAGQMVTIPYSLYTTGGRLDSDRLLTDGLERAFNMVGIVRPVVIMILDHGGLDPMDTTEGRQGFAIGPGLGTRSITRTDVALLALMKEFYRMRGGRLHYIWFGGCYAARGRGLLSSRDIANRTGTIIVGANEMVQYPQVGVMSRHPVPGSAASPRPWQVARPGRKNETLNVEDINAFASCDLMICAATSIALELQSTTQVDCEACEDEPMCQITSEQTFLDVWLDKNLDPMEPEAR